MRRYVLVPIISVCLLAAPGIASEPDESSPERPITDRNVDAVDVAATPVTDLNLRKDKIPQVLIDAQDAPYDLSGLRSCKPLIAAVEELDTILGDDLDLPREERGGPNAGRVAQSVVGSFIPFRGILREVSGANEQQRKVQAAIQAGLARRGFLKGVGQSRGCRYPARPASEKDIARIVAERSAAEKEKKDAKKD